MNIKWKEGSRYKCKVSDAFDFFDKNRMAHNGVIDWDAAESEARKKSSAVHNDLEWNDKVCGKKYRVVQLKKMVRTIDVIHPEMNVSTRAFESVRVEVLNKPIDPKTPKDQIANTRVFMRTEDILADPAARDDLLGQAVRDALAFKRRYAALSELSQVIAAVNSFVAKVGKTP